MSHIKKQGVSVKTIKFVDFFKNNIIYIPKYQREYSWENANVKVFIEDIYLNDNYFIGNVMTQKDGLKLDIIDGQQRIITAFLIFVVIKQMNIAKNHGLVFNNEILCHTINLRMQIQDRTADQNSNIMKYIYSKSTITDRLIETNEYQQYRYITTVLEKYTKEDIFKLYHNLQNCQVVEIDTSNSSIQANKMFLNLNTKGMKLSNSDIVKSLIFSYFESSESFGNYKNLWYDAFYHLKPSEKDDYLLNYLTIYETDKTSRIVKTTIVDEYKKILNNLDSTNKIFDYLASPSSVYHAAYQAVSQGNYRMYEKIFQSSPARLSNLFGYYSFIKKINFIQFNIAFTSMLCYEPKDKSKISQNLLKYIDFVQLIFLFSCYMGLQNISPSSYSNDFIKLSVKMRNKNKIDENIKSVIDNFKGIKKFELEDLDFFDKIEVTSGDKSMKYFVALISYLNGDKTCDYTGEHIYPASGMNSNKLMFSNIVPVINDIYGDMDYQTKILKYRENSITEIHIKNFLDYDFKEDYTDFIQDRGQRYKILFVNKFNSLFEKLTK